MFYFRTEEQAREFASLNPKYLFIDFGEDKPFLKRWAVKVLYKKPSPVKVIQQPIQNVE
jgi:hypothetical protein